MGDIVPNPSFGQSHVSHLCFLSEIILRLIVVLLFSVHAFGAKTWLIQQSFQQVLHGCVARSIIAVIKLNEEVGQVARIIKIKAYWMTARRNRRNIKSSLTWRRCTALHTSRAATQGRDTSQMEEQWDWRGERSARTQQVEQSENSIKCVRIKQLGILVNKSCGYAQPLC